MEDVTFLNSSLNSFSGKLPIFKLDHMHQNQGRTFGPLLRLFLLNLFTKAVTAKYDSYFPFHFTFDPTPWLAYNKPLASYHYHSYEPQWYPVKIPLSNYQRPIYQKYPTLTTAIPTVTSEDYITDDDYDTHYPEENDYGTVTPNPKYVDAFIPAESIKQEKRQPIPNIAKKIEENEKETTTSLYSLEEPMAAESNINPRKVPTQRNRRRGPPPRRNNKYPQKRRKTTTPSPDYYDSYEEYRDYTTERYYPMRRRTRPPPVSYYEEEDDDDDYYDSYEITTKPYRKRRPTRKPVKNQNRRRFTTEPPIEFVPDVDRLGQQTEIVIVRQAMTTTEPTTVITNTTTTTGTTTRQTTTRTPPTTAANTTAVVTNTTTLRPTTTTYGYGPSNGNENISFTYGPPVDRYQYSVPYFDWYTHETARNAIVKKVRDIVSFDKKLKFKGK